MEIFILKQFEPRGSISCAMVEKVPSVKSVISSELQYGVLALG
uniref:Uncharacterized protein n=1 Tax=Arundo donax TaxID=35708 RepID=A0A0A9H8U0_ARUDO